MMPTPIEIPRTVSAPMDPDAPSLLTTLSADIRLLIFEVLFRRDGPFLLHNADAYHAEEPDVDDYGWEEIGAANKEYDDLYCSEIGQDSDFTHAYDMGIAVLLSCRQIYHEGAAMLYSANEFIISRVTNRHDCMQSDVYHWCWKYHPFWYAADWLSDIGSQHSLLRKIVLDTDPLCPKACEHRMVSFDILPLARYIWTHPGMEHKIKFGQSGRPMLQHNDDRDFEGHKRAQNLNFMLSEIIVKDSLNLKRFIFSDRILATITVAIDERAGQVNYPATRSWQLITSHCEPVYSRTFSIFGGNSDTRIQLGERNTIRGLLHAMQMTKGEIIRHCFTNSKTVTINLDNNSLCGFSFRLFQISQEIRQEFFKRLAFYDDKDIVINMTSRELSTNFGKFSSLDKVGLRKAGEYITRVSISPIHQIIGHRTTAKACTYIVLRLAVPIPGTLEMARVDIRELSGRLLRICGVAKVFVRFVLTYPRGQKFHREEHTVSLLDLQSRLFLLISGVLIQFDSDEGSVRRELPSIWINGRGDVVKASFPAEDGLDELSVGYAYKTLNRSEVRMEGYRMSRLLKDYALDKTLVKDRGPLVMMWHDLLNEYWADHGTRYLP
jgi:hypothetical protein